MDISTVVDRVIPGPGSTLDRVSSKLQAALSEAVKHPAVAPVAKALHGNDWLGHPLHPVLIVLPLGAWSVTGWYDLRGARSGDPTYDDVADAALRVGVIGAVAAAATGFAQFLDTSGNVRRETTVHAAMNNVALTLYLASMAARRVGARSSGRAMSALAYGLVSVSGYLGGDLSYRHGVGVERQAVEPLASTEV